MQDVHTIKVKMKDGQNIFRISSCTPITWRFKVKKIFKNENNRRVKGKKVKKMRFLKTIYFESLNIRLCYTIELFPAI